MEPAVHRGMRCFFLIVTEAGVGFRHFYSFFFQRKRENEKEFLVLLNAFSVFARLVLLY